MHKSAFTPSSHLTEGEFDVVIIGSGVGGLTSGLLLAKEGFKVCVLEQHYRPGGYLHRFFRKRVPFDTGFHYLGGIDEGGTLNRYLKFLGIREKLKFHALDPDGFDVLKFPDYEFRVPAGWPAYIHRLHSEFPTEKTAIDTFASVCQEICRQSFAYSFEHLMDTGKYSAVTLGSFLDTLNCSTRLRAVLCGQGFLYGVPPKESPLELHALVIDSMLQGPVGLDGGGDALAKVMVDGIKDHGGSVRTRTRVTSLSMKDGKVDCAITERGEQVRGRTFISNVHPQHMLDLLPTGTFKPAYTNRVKGLKNSMACVAGYYTSTNKTAPKRNHNLYVLPGYDADAMYLENGFFPNNPNPKGVFLTFPSDRESNWEFDRMILALGGMNWVDVSQFSDTKTGKRGEEYQKYKTQLGLELQQTVEQSIPEYAGTLKCVEVSTPLTNRDYVGAVEGGIYGLRHSMERWGKYTLLPRTKVENLYMCGHSVSMPGVVGVTIGAFVTCGLLIGFDELFERVGKV